MSQPLAAATELLGYAWTMAEDRRKCPRQDIVTKLVQADADGAFLASEEFGFFVLLLAVAGNETTRNAITHGMKAFFDHPEQWELFKSERPKTAGDEIVRYATPVMSFQRTAMADTVLSGVEIKQGQRVGMFYSSANFDEEVFTDPERYVIDDDVWSRALRTDSSAHADVATGAARGVAIFGTESPAGLRLALMERFFSELTEQINGIDLTDPAVTDAMTVLAALVHGGRALTVDELAVALGWTRTRTIAALAALEAQPAVADPFVVKVEGDRCSVAARVDRLSPGQREALRAK